jgi:hypothetical protein
MACCVTPPDYHAVMGPTYQGEALRTRTTTFVLRRLQETPRVRRPTTLARAGYSAPATPSSISAGRARAGPRVDDDRLPLPAQPGPCGRGTQEPRVKLRAWIGFQPRAQHERRVPAPGAAAFTASPGARERSPRDLVAPPRCTVGGSWRSAILPTLAARTIICRPRLFTDLRRFRALSAGSSAAARAPSSSMIRKAEDQAEPRRGRQEYPGGANTSLHDPPACRIPAQYR